jgi:hypothetical protein
MAETKPMSRRQLAKLVEAWRKMLIPEWRVTLKETLPPDHDGDCWATCQTSDDYRSITVHFTDDLLEESPRQVEITIVHEFLHALTRPWRKLIDDVEYEVSKPKFDLLNELREHEEEQLVDRLSCVLVAQTHGAEAFGTIEPDA